MRVENGISLPNNQHQRRTSHAPKDVLPSYVLITVLRVSRVGDFGDAPHFAFPWPLPLGHFGVRLSAFHSRVCTFFVDMGGAGESVERFLGDFEDFFTPLEWRAMREAAAGDEDAMLRAFFTFWSSGFISLKTIGSRL